MSIQRGGRLDRRSGFEELPRRRRARPGYLVVLALICWAACAAIAVPLFVAPSRTGWLP